MLRRNDDYDCIIVGAGPAGLTAALYLQRFNRHALVVDGGSSRVEYAPCIRNLIGYTSGISGRVLLKRLRRQTRSFGATIVKGRAVIHREHRSFRIQVGSDLYRSRFVILASGIQDIQPRGVDFTHLCAERLIAYCPVCDGFDHRGESIGVFIQSIRGLRNARFISAFSSRLHIIALKNFQISRKLQQELKANSMTLHQGALKNLKRAAFRNRLEVHLKGQRPFQIDVGYIELGAKVSNQATQHLHGLRKASNGRIHMNRHQQTSIQGLYAIGDCANSLAQVSVAVGEAAIAATHIHNRLLIRERRLKRRA